MQKESSTLVDDELLFYLLETKYKLPKIKIMCKDLNKIEEHIKTEYFPAKKLKYAVHKELIGTTNDKKSKEVKNLYKQFVLTLHQLQRLIDKLDTTQPEIKDVLLAKCKRANDFQLKYIKEFKSFGIEL